MAFRGRARRSSSTSASRGRPHRQALPFRQLVDTIKMDDGTTIDVTITDVVNPCVFFKAADFGLGLTGLELPNPDWSLKGPPAATSTVSCVSGSDARSFWRGPTGETLPETQL